MKKILFTLFLVIGAIGIQAQTVKIYKAGTVVYSSASADSAVFHDPAAHTGKFSISADKQVAFAPGNLQYTRSTDTWSFADTQYDFIGNANITDGALADKIDLFGWSASNTTAPFGVSMSDVSEDYLGDFVDWGTNSIDAAAPNTWRTLTNDEWEYLRYTRTNADSLIGAAHINLNVSGGKYVNGVILLPDDWTCPAGITFKRGLAAEESEQAFADHQTLTLDQWKALEAAGAVLLPAAGDRTYKMIGFVGESSVYWSATPYDSISANSLLGTSIRLQTTWFRRHFGCAVRLVQDYDSPMVKVYKGGKVVYSVANADSVVFAKTPAPVPVGKFFVGAGKQVSFAPGNLQYTRSTDTWAFAEHQYDHIGEANMSNGNFADKIDFFGWSSSNPLAPFGVSTSQDNADYAGAFVDWGTNTISGDAAGTWRTLTKDEWIYLFQHTRWTMATVNGVFGFILLPSGYGVSGMKYIGDGKQTTTIVDFAESAYDTNIYSAEDFAKMETNGCVFLPCAGYRDGADITIANEYDIIEGGYWSATPNGNSKAAYFGISEKNAGTVNIDRYIGFSVRLVKDVEVEPTTAPVGEYAVSATKKVAFASGNLRYTYSTNTWSFAEHQSDMIGVKNVNGSVFANTTDLFGWSGDGTVYAENGLSLSTDNADYSGRFQDWGSLTIGDDNPGMWRTLAKEEWIYLLQHTRWTMAKVDGIFGFMLLPDRFTPPASMKIIGDGKQTTTIVDFAESAYAGNNYSAEDFAQMEAKGCVFLPCAGFRVGLEITIANEYDIIEGGYWSATPNGNSKAAVFCISQKNAGAINMDRYIGFSVRLVKDL